MMMPKNRQISGMESHNAIVPPNQQPLRTVELTGMLEMRS
jgi:hypothetical protein